MTVAGVAHCHHVVQRQRLRWIDAANLPLPTEWPRTPSTMPTISDRALALTIGPVVCVIAQRHTSGTFDHLGILLYGRNISISHLRIRRGRGSERYGLVSSTTTLRAHPELQFGYETFSNLARCGPLRMHHTRQRWRNSFLLAEPI